MKNTTATIERITYELQNPLLLFQSSLHQIEALHPEVLSFQYWDHLRTESQYLQNLINDLRDYNEERRFFMHVFDVKEVIFSMEQGLDAYATEQEKQFVLQMPGQKLPPLFGNSLKLKQAFLNIIYYAFEVTNKGGRVTFVVRKYKDKLLFFITDDGPKKSATEIENFFEPFLMKRGSKPSIGLALSKKYIEDHHGDIYITSKSTRGTTITISLPYLW